MTEDTPLPLDDSSREPLETTAVLSTIRIRRTLMHLSPFALHSWLLFKNTLFAGAFCCTIAQVWIPEFLVPFRLVFQLILVWAIQSLILTRHKAGVSYLLVTTRGVLVTDLNIYLGKGF